MKDDAAESPARVAGAAAREGRLINALLVLCALFFAVAATLAVALLLQWNGIARERGELAAREALLDELLAGSDSDLAVIPHTAPGVSFVLNPKLDTATFKAGEAGPYPVSPIGLRGQPIKDKAPGVTRVALVGDSVFFGWKLAERDRLETVLTSLAAERVTGDSVEFVTIALPGWNTQDQAAFLEHHLGRIDPDHIVWSLIRNDLIDTPGAIPPGLLASWNSPQRSGLSTYEFTRPDAQLDLPNFSNLARWRSNLATINDFGEAHGIGISLLWWRSRQRAILDYLTATGTQAPRTVYIPGRFRYDKARWCVAAPDCHPTRWANEQLAIGLLQELAERDVLTLRPWPPAEEAVATAFAEEAAAATTDAAQAQFLRDAAARLTSAVDETTEPAELAATGLRGRTMTRDGLLLLRTPTGAGSVKVILRPIRLLAGRPLEVRLNLRSADGRTRSAEHTLTAGENRIELELPASPSFGLIELAWRFSRVECVAPSRCVAARLVSARVD